MLRSIPLYTRSLTASWKLLGLLLSLSLASGCSTATRFGYNHLDWFAKREIGKYFDMTRQQEAWFETRFDALWRWHRHEQLPLYVQDLRRLAEQAQTPMSRDDIAAALQMVEAHIDRSLQQATADTVALLAQLDQRQVTSLLARIDEDIADAAKDLAKDDDTERRKAAAKRVRKWMEDRYGRLIPEQRARIDQWAAERSASPEAWLDHSHRWRDAFAALLAQRDTADFADQVATLLFDDTALVPEPLLAERSRNRARWLDMAADLSALTTARQRRHLVEYITDFAEDFDALAAQARD
ncbi:MAG: DUF6279 family lipoprotein [Pseudomonadota bacterium]|nr:DUF6279 family lipoprotein [Pseudomonadota bacterium]